MQIGVVIDTFDPAKGGAERALALFVGAAESAGHEVVVLAMSAAPGAPGRLATVVVPPAPRGPRDAMFAKRALVVARRERCDVAIGVRHIAGVDVYWPHGGLHSETLAAVARSRGRVGAAVSRALHHASPKQRTLVALERRFFADPGDARIWCVSELVRREIAAQWPGCTSRLELRPNGVDVDEFHPRLRAERRAAVRAKLGVGKDVPLLLFLGGNWRLKGWLVMLAALKRLRGSRWACVAAGTKHEAAARVTMRAGLDDRVQVLPRADTRDLYAAADLFVQPTWRDPCSLATLEALACGLPVVTTDANGAGDALDGFPGAGAIVAAGDADALSRAISERLVARKSHNADARRAAETRPQTEWLDGLVTSIVRATSSAAPPRP